MLEVFKIVHNGKTIGYEVVYNSGHDQPQPAHINTRDTYPGWLPGLFPKYLSNGEPVGYEKRKVYPAHD